MFVRLSTLLAAATVAHVLAIEPPHLDVPACPAKATITYNQSVPNLTEFPLTQVDICWTYHDIKVDFTAFEEKSYYFNESQVTNDPIWKYEVMEAFIASGTEDPNFYFEFEVAPSNVTFNAYIFNPSKVREEGAPFETYYVKDPVGQGILSHTTIDKEKSTWASYVQFPRILFFGIEEGFEKGQRWRMNFFRTVTSPEHFPDQEYGAWSVPDAANFHKTPFFGHVELV